MNDCQSEYHKYEILNMNFFILFLSESLKKNDFRMTNATAGVSATSIFLHFFVLLLSPNSIYANHLVQIFLLGFIVWSYTRFLRLATNLGQIYTSASILPSPCFNTRGCSPMIGRN